MKLDSSTPVQNQDHLKKKKITAVSETVFFFWKNIRIYNEISKYSLNFEKVSCLSKLRFIIKKIGIQ